MHDLTRHLHNADHPLTRIDPRVKLLCALALLVMTISCRGMVFPLLVAAGSLGLCLALGARPKVLAVRFAQPLLIAATVLLLKLFFAGTVPLFTLNLFGLELVGHRDGLLEGLLIAARIGGAVSLVALLGYSTSFTELMAALAWLRLPRGFIEVALLAWRYLFVIFDDAQVVYAAQKNRLGYTGYRRGLRSFGALAGALVIKAFDTSQSMTVAMVQRGYDGQMPLLKQRPFRLAEIVCSVLLICIMAVVWQA